MKTEYVVMVETRDALEWSSDILEDTVYSDHDMARDAMRSDFMREKEDYSGFDVEEHISRDRIDLEVHDDLHCKSWIVVELSVDGD